MELLIYIILVIGISLVKGKTKNGQRKGNGSAGYGQYADKVKQTVKTIDSSLTELAEKNGARGFAMGRRKKAAMEKQKQLEAARKRELEERKKRDAIEQRKKAEELRKKQEEQRRKQVEEERKKKEAQEMLKKFGVSSMEVQKRQEASCEEVCKDECKELCEKPAAFRIEDYLDPLTASFYPGNKKEEKKDGFCVDDYLFPALAPYYPKTEVSDLFKTGN